MLSKTCEYALRAMIYIAQQSSDGSSVNIRQISENISSPQLFIAKILQQLCHHGFLQSAQGRYGGFRLAENQAQASLADIITAVDGEKIFHGCGLGLAYCSEDNPCPIHHTYKDARDELHRIYSNTTLQQFRTQTPERLLLRRD